MGKKFPVVVIEHTDVERIDERVYVWGEDAGLKTVQRCLQRGETVEVRLTKMTQKQYDELPDYEGEC